MTIDRWLIRNTIVNAWLHRPARSAARQTWHRIAGSPKNWATLKGVAMVIPCVPWIIRERSVMSPQYEKQLQVLEHFIPQPMELATHEVASAVKSRAAH